MSSDSLLFGDCAKLIRSSISPNNYPNTPYIGLEHIGQETLMLQGHSYGRDVDSQKNQFTKGDILFGKLRPYFRKVIIAPFSGMCSTDIWVVQPKKNVDRDFLFYWMASKDFVDAASNASEGTRMPRAKWDVVSKIRIPFKSLSEQRSIGRVLKSLTDRITLLRETNITLESIVQAIFKSWFIDFDPVKAKQQGQEPQGIDPATVALFPDTFQDSELGPIPEGWMVKPFGKLLSQTIGGDWGSETLDQKNTTKVSIIRGTDFSSVYKGDFSKIPTRYTTLKKLKSRELQDGDIILEISGGSTDQPTGRSLFITNCLLDQFENPVEPASFCRLLRPLNKSIGIILGQHLTRIYLQGKTWEYQIQSTGISNFQTSYFLETELVILPSEKVLNAFVGIIQPIINRTHLKQIRQLIELRDTLLPRLISGKLRLPEAEAIVTETTG
jgi:type I restriction enzyme, S subunit